MAKIPDKIHAKDLGDYPELAIMFNKPLNVKKKNKYNAKKVEYKGITYDSKKEANYAIHLDDLLAKKEIISYERQVPFRYILKDKLMFTYLLDFQVEYPDRIEYIDIKGYKAGAGYAIFKLKKKIIETYFDIIIKEL